jgi:hypothetical protein
VTKPGKEQTMSPTLLSTSDTHRRRVRRESRLAERRKPVTSRERRPLGRYVDAEGHPREVIARRALAGSVLVVDRNAVRLDDCRLVAHLAADEPAENAAVVCSAYLQDLSVRSLRCRDLTVQDARVPPLASQIVPAMDDTATCTLELVDATGCSYALERVSAGMSIPALRWSRRRPRAGHAESEPVSLRETIASLESYEPMRTLTTRALAFHRDDVEVSTSVLGAELVRVLESPIVLNRRLREVVLAALAGERLSMSEIAIRCGRIKRDSKGNESGETSWLARRVGLLPESGHRDPTPWIHSDVLALIARRGLAIAPREVEVQ